MNKKQEKKLKKIDKAIDKLCKAMYGKEYKSIGSFSVRDVPNYANSIGGDMVLLSNNITIDFTMVQVKDK